MRRRTFVTGTATAATLGLAGCLGGKEETRTDDEHVEALRTEIKDRDVEVIDIKLD